MRLLIQRTIDTGQERLARLSEVEPDILAELGPLLREAIKSGQRVHVGAGSGCILFSPGLRQLIAGLTPYPKVGIAPTQMFQRQCHLR